MRAAICFSHFQLPRCQIHTFSSSWWEKIHNFSKKSSSIHALQGGNNTNSKRWTRKSLSTNTEGIGKNILNKKRNNIGQQITDVTSFTHTNLNTSRVEINESKSIHPEQKISEDKDVSSKLVTIFVFDIETTGFNRENERIIEIALQDLSGGVNSTFETLVNPDKYVTNPHIHGISTYMVNRPGVPRMKDLIPILIDYVKSRQKPGGQTLFIAHNGKSFDVPFFDQ